MKKYDKEIMQAQLDNEKAVLKALENNYSDALEEINSKIADLMGRADADMQHVIYQVEYQKALKKQIEGILLQLQTNEFEAVSEYLTKSYEEGFLGTMYSMQSQGVPLVFPINQEEIVAAIQHETNLTTSLYQAFDMKDLQKKIAGEISRGFSTGASFKEVARNVDAVTNIGKNKAMRIARTEGHRITETAAHSAQMKAKDRGADVVKVWDAALDSRTRPSHVRVDGEIKELEEKFSNGLMFPGDPSGSAAEVINCRCRSRTDARWALDADETKILGNTSKMSDDQKQRIADKLHIPVEELDQYSDQVIPIKAKNYADFKKQYKQLWNYEGSALQKEVEPRIAKLEQARTGKKSSEKEKQYGVMYGEDAAEVDFDYINSDDYKDKFRKITDNQKANESIHKLSKTMLQHCDGTEHEDLYLLSTDGEVIAKVTDSVSKLGINYSEEFKAALADVTKNKTPVIAVHNHPHGTPPSSDDFRKAYENKYATGVIVGHNGQIYVYSNANVKITPEQADQMASDIEFLYRMGWDIDRASKLVYDDYGLNYTIIEGVD